MPKFYLYGAANRSAREERAKQIAKMPKMSAFLKPAPPPMKLLKKLSPEYHEKSNIPESLTFQIWRIFSLKKRHASE